MSEQFKEDFVSIFQQQQQKLTDRLWKAYQLSVRQIQSEFVRMEMEMRQLGNMARSQQLQKLICNVQELRINSMAILENYSDVMVVYCFGKEDMNILPFLKKRKQQTKLKMNILNRQISLQRQDEQQHDKIQILQLLNDYDTRPKLFRFCPNYTSLKSQDAPKELQAHLDAQIRQSLQKMIQSIDRKFDQYKNIYSLSVNEPDVDQLFLILKSQYRRALNKISKSKIIPQQVLNMKQLYTQIKATLTQQISKARQKQNQNYKKINPNYGRSNQIQNHIFYI